MKIIQITDLHLVAPGTLLHGLDPLERLEKCLADVEARHGDAELCVFSGDLVDRGEAAAYDAIRERLARFALPYRLMIGNHDSRPAFRTAFPDHAVDDNGFVQSAMQCGTFTVLCLDTHVPGERHGELCGQRLAWFEERVSACAPDTALVFMHHPPFHIGIPRLDVISVTDPHGFADVAGRYRDRIRHIFFGHVHRPVFGSWHGIPHSALPAINHQVPYDPVTPAMAYSDEPPAYAVILAEDDRLIVHQEFFLHRAALPEHPA